MREPFKSNFKAKVAAEYKTNDESFGPLYTAMMNVLIDDLCNRIELLDLMEIEGIQNERKQIEVMDTLFRDIRDIEVGKSVSYTIIRNSKEYKFTLTCELP